MKVFTEENLLLNGKKYVLSIGKRQPMHIGHKIGLEKLVKIPGVKLVYAMGSTNLKGDELFDPITNPLSIAEQQEQFKIVFPNAEAVFICVDDDKDISIWGDLLIEALAKQSIRPEECVIYFQGKPEDKISEAVNFTLKNNMNAKLNKGEWLIESLKFWGFDFWFDNELEGDLTLSARNLRKLDLEFMSEKEKNLFAAPEYIINLAKQARSANPNKDKMEGFPLTMYDISLRRIHGF